LLLQHALCRFSEMADCLFYSRTVLLFILLPKALLTTIRTRWCPSLGWRDGLLCGWRLLQHLLCPITIAENAQRRKIGKIGKSKWPDDSKFSYDLQVLQAQELPCRLWRAMKKRSSSEGENPTRDWCSNPPSLCCKSFPYSLSLVGRPCLFYNAAPSVFLVPCFTSMASGAGRTCMALHAARGSIAVVTSRTGSLIYSAGVRYPPLRPRCGVDTIDPYFAPLHVY
jgi:hypothetical protein